MSRPVRSLPRDRVAIWPPTDTVDDVELAVVVGLVANLRTAMGDRSGRDVGRTAGVHHTVIHKILSGTTWPDLVTIARLEAALGTDLWPAEVASSLPPMSQE